MNAVLVLSQAVAAGLSHHEHEFPPPSADLLLLGPPPPLQFVANAPTRGVAVDDLNVLSKIMLTNANYLVSSFSVDHMLHPFRVRAGATSPPTGPRAQIKFWDEDLKGANAGRFLMGAGNTLRWRSNTELSTMVRAVLDGITACTNAEGYMLPYHLNGWLHSEQGDYARSWLTQGLIEVGKAGFEDAFSMLRGQYDWIVNQTRNCYAPYLYDGISNGEQGQIASTRMYLEHPNPRYEDAQFAQDVYRDDDYLRALTHRDPLSISDYHMPAPNHPHCYEITAFIAYFDSYRATRNDTYLHAVEGAWDILLENFIHVDGSSSLTEGRPNYAPKTYRIKPGTNTGETCCTTFWIKLAQRFALLRPTNETYSAAIEISLYNALLRQQVPRPLAQTQSRLRRRRKSSVLPPGIRYHAVMEGKQEAPHNINTCCEGQGTRAFGSLPEYIFSTGVRDALRVLYVNLYTAASINLTAAVATSPIRHNVTNLNSPEDLPPETLTMVAIARNATFGIPLSDAMPSALSLKECKTLCFTSTHPNMCEGITWRTRAPPPRTPSCNASCVLVEMPAAGATRSNSTRFYKGTYADAKFPAGTTPTLQLCQNACLGDPACVQLTWATLPGGAPRASAPCVLYSAIYGDLWPTISGAAGWIKCNSGATNATECAPLTPGAPSPRPSSARCLLHTAIDETVALVPSPGVNQYRVNGRRIHVQRDYVPMTAVERARALNVAEVVAPASPLTVTLNTTFPFSNDVRVTVVTSSAMSPVALTLSLRMPSWIPSTSRVTLRLNNGTPLQPSGSPGTFYELTRFWSNGDHIDFTLPIVYTLNVYTGVDQVKGYDGKRYALKRGPIVLACVGKLDASTNTVVLRIDPSSDPAKWLKSIRGSPLHFTVDAAPGMTFMPLWEVPNEATFTIYPIFTTKFN